MTDAEILTYLKTIVSEETKVPIEKIENSHTFFELGLDSISAVYLLELVENQYSIDLKALDFWDYPTLGAFAEFVQSIKK